MDKVLYPLSASYIKVLKGKTYEAAAGISIELCGHGNTGAQIENGVEGIEDCHEERTRDTVYYSSREEV